MIKSFYGKTFGKSCIEIHHLKPMFQYASMSIVQTIDSGVGIGGIQHTCWALRPWRVCCIIGVPLFSKT